MRFTLTEEQEAFAEMLEALLSEAGTPAVARAWADGDPAPGLELWGRLAKLGVNGLLVPTICGGEDATRVEVAVAMEALGRHAVPGPWVESVAYLPAVLGDDASLAAVAAGLVGTVAAPPHTPHALDADVAEVVLHVAGGRVHDGVKGELLHSVDPTRRLFRVTPATRSGSRFEGAKDAFDLATLACAAQLLGAGERLLADSVAYVKQRSQFGRPIGSYQAIKHQLADVRIALDFARPLVQQAAIVRWSDPDRPRDVSAAKVAAADAAYLASRVALQVHGAVGYTRELDLSLWILKVRALQGAWGTPAYHRSRVLAALTGA